MSGVDYTALQQALTPRLTKYIPFDPTPKQRAFLLMNSTKEILYGGAAGGGKSVGQLMAALQFVDIPRYSAILFRKTYADLSLPGALIHMSREWLAPFIDRGEVKWYDKDKRYVFPSGATLSFGYLESLNDAYRYQGAEFQYIGMDEVTHIAPSSYRYLFSRLRRSKDIDVPLRFRATSNPGGEYGEYYYQRFFVEGPDKGRLFIGATLDDNPFLDTEEYEKALEELDPVTREQLRHGNWSVKEEGDMFSRSWFHLVPSSEVPLGVQRVRFWDLASTDPKKRKGRDKREPDYTVGMLLAHTQGAYWIEDIARVQKSPSEVEDLIKATAQQDGYSVAIRIEQEPGSSGDITIDHYARNVLNGYDFQGVRSTGSKVERAKVASSAAQSGRVAIVANCRNMLPFFDECDVFPYGIKDDTIDAFSGAFTHFRNIALPVAPTSSKKIGGSYWSRIGGGV